MICLLNVNSSQLSSLTSHFLNCLQPISWLRRFIGHIDWVVGGTTVAFLTDFVFLSHFFVSLFLSGILLLHEFPSLDISLHLCQATSFDQRLLLEFFLLALLSVMICVIFGESIHWSGKMWRFWIRVINFSVVYKLMVPTNILSHSQLVDEVVIVVLKSRLRSLL